MPREKGQTQKYPYKGKMITLLEATRLPECRVSVRTVFRRKQEKPHLTIAECIKSNGGYVKKVKPVKVLSDKKQEIADRNKKIMSRPINPMKCGYTALGLGLMNVMLRTYGGQG
jgi:hypothetical protein